jgi:hypothetical protein
MHICFFSHSVKSDLYSILYGWILFFNFSSHELEARGKI